MSLLWKPSRLTNPLLVDVSFVESCGHIAHASRPRLHFRSEVGVSSIKPININGWRFSASDSTAHIRMETLRGNRGLGSGCHGALKNVSKGAELVFYYGVQMLRRVVRWLLERVPEPAAGRSVLVLTPEETDGGQHVSSGQRKNTNVSL